MRDRNNGMERRRATDGRVTKRKAESQDITNERLSKRLESLNLGLYPSSPLNSHFN